MGSFFPFLKTVFNNSVSLFDIALKTLFHKELIYKMLGLTWFKTQEASRAAITFLTKFSYIEN